MAGEEGTMGKRLGILGAVIAVVALDSVSLLLAD
jgi:hypothetical protein